MTPPKRNARTAKREPMTDEEYEAAKRVYESAAPEPRLCPTCGRGPLRADQTPCDGRSR